MMQNSKHKHSCVQVLNHKGFKLLPFRTQDFLYTLPPSIFSLPPSPPCLARHLTHTATLQSRLKMWGHRQGSVLT